MHLISPRDDPRIAEYVATHRGSDYREYLLDYDPSFVRYRVDTFLSPDAGRVFASFGPRGVSALAKLTHLPWDTDCLGVESAKVASLFGGEEEKVTLLGEVVQQASDEGFGLLTCRVAYDDLSSVHALERTGFRLADAMSIFLWDTERQRPGPHQPPTLGEVAIDRVEGCDEATVKALQRIAASAFSCSRIANDPQVPAARRTSFHTRLLSSFVGHADVLVLVAWRGGEPIGFAVGAGDPELRTCLSRTIGYLWLIAVDEACAGQGVGQALLAEFIRTFSQEASLIEVGTQVNNYPALNLYARHGLRLVSSLVTMHRWA